jgi:L-threonylcarbamoyladenylate synthase
MSLQTILICPRAVMQSKSNLQRAKRHVSQGHDPNMSLLPTPANENSIRLGAEHLRAGHLVAFPTETVYGLGADARNGKAVAQIFAAKGRPNFNPLIVHVTSLQAASDWAEFNPIIERLAEAFWPGGLTLVLNQRPGNGLADLVSAGLPTVAIRVPSHPVARQLIAEAGCPVAAPSANRSGHVSATTADHVAADLGTHPALAMILDDGPAALGLESTIIDGRDGRPHLLRPGAVTAEALAEIAGEPVLPASAHLAVSANNGALDSTEPRPSPGLLASHYAPSKPLLLNILSPSSDQALLAFGPPPVGHSGEIFNLSPSGDLIEASANLFIALRALDSTSAATIAAMPIPLAGLGLAINDRLQRAAAPRGN